MTAKQLSVFIENRQGRLGEVLAVLKKNDVNILSLSLADTTEYGLLRILVNKPEKGKEMLIAEGFSSMITEILVIKVPHTAGSLQKLLQLIADNNISIEYMYGLSIDGTDASIAMKTNDIDGACKVLKDNGIETIVTKDLENL
jgi:hypothetical protein